MKAVALSASIFIFCALIWAVHVPLASFATVKKMADPATDYYASENALQGAGSGSTMALKAGLVSDSIPVRLHCARILALRGERDGDRVLLEILRANGAETLRAQAEYSLIQVWNERDAPDPSSLAKLARLESGSHTDSEKLTAISELLLKHPGWSGGYVRRARIHQRNSEPFEARRDILSALMIEPDNFEAIVELAAAYLALNGPEQAYLSLEQAIRINPRLKESLRDEIKETVRMLDFQRTKQRNERRHEKPIA